MDTGQRFTFFDYADLESDVCHQIESILSEVSKKTIELPWVVEEHKDVGTSTSVSEACEMVHHPEPVASSSSSEALISNPNPPLAIPAGQQTPYPSIACPPMSFYPPSVPPPMGLIQGPPHHAVMPTFYHPQYQPAMMFSPAHGVYYSLVAGGEAQVLQQHAMLPEARSEMGSNMYHHGSMPMPVMPMPSGMHMTSGMPVPSGMQMSSGMNMPSGMPGPSSMQMQTRGMPVQSGMHASHQRIISTMAAPVQAASHGGVSGVHQSQVTSHSGVPGMHPKPVSSATITSSLAGHSRAAVHDVATGMSDNSQPINNVPLRGTTNTETEGYTGQEPMQKHGQHLDQPSFSHHQQQGQQHQQQSQSLAVLDQSQSDKASSLVTSVPSTSPPTSVTSSDSHQSNPIIGEDAVSFTHDINKVSEKADNSKGEYGTLNNNRSVDSAGEAACQSADICLPCEGTLQITGSEVNHEAALIRKEPVNETSVINNLEHSPDDVEANAIESPTTSAGIKLESHVDGEIAKSSLTPTPPAGTSKQRVMSWASLLQNTPSATNAIVISVDSRQSAAKSACEARASTNVKDMPAIVEPPVDASTEEKSRKQLSEWLKNHQPSHRSVSLQPRGLTNRGNWCYVNATLQALLACPPFYHLLKHLPERSSNFWDTNKMPVIKSMLEFVNEFSAIQVKSIEKHSVNAKGTVRVDIKCGMSFEPVYIYKMLQDIDYEAFKHGQQEDAEEFLSCILNRLHDEMVSAIKYMDRVEGDSKASPAPGSDDLSNGNHNGDIEHTGNGDDSGADNTRWEQVRSRNRTVYNCVANGESSPVSAIFRGQICSVLHQLGQKESASLQPFFTLQLDIQSENIKSVQDALDQLVSKESLQGYTCTKSKQEVDATRRTLIEELPPVLVLHLKWFTYNKNGGLQKCMKQVDFDVDLELNKELLTGNAAKSKNSTNHRRYKLFAAVNHIGARAVGGHYTADIFHPGYNCWMRCDDDSVTSVPVAAVTRYSVPKVPYLIFYRRLDLTS